MQPSPECQRFGGRFVIGIHDLFDDLEDHDRFDALMNFVLTPAEGEGRVRLRAFLENALVLSDEELQRLWKATPADIYVHDTAELRTMLQDAIGRLGR